MKTQISRDSFNRNKRYSGVYLQQGRMITDADWNEETEIERQRLDDALADVVTSGVPRENGLRLDTVAGQPLRLRRGRVYAGGVGALVTGTPADPALPFTLGQQADFPLPDGVTAPATNYRLYADLWERTVTSVEDPTQLRDPAFHGADTATRTQTMAQLKWCNAAVDPEDPNVNPRIGDAKLKLTLRKQLAGLDPCDPCAREITVPPRVGNYLFRVEVHAVEGTPKNPTRVILKWSTENGAEHHEVGNEPPDFKGSDWVYEYYTTRTDKHLGVHLPGGITPLSGSLFESFQDPPPAGFGFVRRWDGYSILRRSGTTWSLQDGRERNVDLSTGLGADEDGHVGFASNAFGAQLSTMKLDLTLSSVATFVAGDYWLVAVRESVQEAGDVVLDEALPAGILHNYLLLATIDGTGVRVTPDTNRQQRLDFPSLTSLAARDVDYTTNCPSGLFDASQDTVQKALDRVCGINATHVAFNKPCDTSVYKGVDPATINTVAKALALLCDVRAEQISYKNDPACTTLAGATTVQQALHLLCMKQSSGCRTTIGIGGEFPTLNAAVDAFVARGERHLCFCLLPGDHVVGQPIVLTKQQTAFSLEGCGPASTLHLDAAITCDGVDSVRLDNIGMIFKSDVLLIIIAGKEVVIDGCAITIQEHDAEAPILLGATHLVHVANNDVQSVHRRQLKLGRDFFNVNPTLKALFSERLTDEEVRVEAQKAVVKLAESPVAERKKLAAALQAQLKEKAVVEGAPVARKLALAPREANQFQLIAKLLPHDASVNNDLARELVTVREFLLSNEPSLAIVLIPLGGLVNLTANRIVGIVSLYGKPGEVRLSDDQLKELRARLTAQPLIRLDAAEDSLVISGNQISQLKTGGDLIIQLRDLIEQNKPGTVSRLFRTTRLTDNVFSLGENDILSVESTLSANRFAQGVARLAMVISDVAFYVSNLGVRNESFLIKNVTSHSNTTTRGDLNTVVIQDP